MNTQLAIQRVWVGLSAGIVLLNVLGCSKQSSSAQPDPAREARVKLDQILPEMIRLSTNGEEKVFLGAAQPFLNIRGLDMQITGFSIPIGTNGRQAHVSFTIAHLRKTSPEALAKEALEDFQMAARQDAGNR